MPVYHFTLHAYRSWRPDNKRGYVRRGGKLHPPDAAQAQKYDARAKHEPAVFTTEVQRILIRTAANFCERRKLRLHAAGSDPSHIHFVISWRAYSSWTEILRRLKNILSKELNEQLHCTRPWFVRGANSKRVSNRGHLELL
jgi:REP element-mobilizing transposase RayT